jgi:meso-butanediol dehydrogenase / (S,S)-butanediol dehydrogenase / diacetyl reductase
VVVGSRSQRAGKALEEQARRWSSDRRLAFQATDVVDPAAVKGLIDFALDRFGRLDVAYGSAGAYEIGDALETNIDAWHRTIDVNLGGQFFLAKYALPHLLARQGGTIVLTASELGRVGTKRSVAYCAAKGGVINLVRALAVDCEGTGVRVNCLAPGPVDTEMLDGGFRRWPDPAAVRLAQLRPLLLGRFGQPEEIAQAALFLASDESSFMTGGLLTVDGGATSWYGF